jgi:hypothetical protein
MLIGMLRPERIELWFAQERLARAIACECECPENRARWTAMAEQWAALAQIEAALICGELPWPSVQTHIWPRARAPESPKFNERKL